MPTITVRRSSQSATPRHERELMRRSIQSAEAEHFRCVLCRRTPLTGELVHFYAAGRDEQLVCDLCRDLRDERPGRSELMHPPDHERSVRVFRTVA